MRMIDKDALLSDIERTIEESGCVNHEGEIMDCIRYASEVDAVPVVRGEWVKKSSELTETLALCSKCSYPVAFWHKTNYCPNCGAKMEDKP